MTYFDSAKQSGRRPIAIARLYLPTCNLEYGVGPCTAALGTTGSTRCYNTKKTCQDRPNFTYDQDANGSAENYLLFSSERIDTLRGDYLNNPANAPCIPTIIDLKGNPTRMQPGEALSERASVQITLQDCFLDDGFFDKYADTRGHGGTLWNRIIARFYSFNGVRLEVETGYLNDAGEYDASLMVPRQYFVDKFSGPTAKGVITLRAKDPLNKVRVNRAECPAPSFGSLANDVPGGTFPITGQVWDIVGTQPDGTAAILQYEDALNNGQTSLVMEDEIVNLVAVNTGASQITVNRFGGSGQIQYPRGFQGLEGPDYDAGEKVQIAHAFDQLRIDEVARELIEDFAGIPEGVNGFFDFAEWSQEADTWQAGYFLSALVTEPTEVGELLSELAEIGAQLWWQDRSFPGSEARIRYKAFTPAFSGDVVLDDNKHIIASSVKISEDIRRRISRCNLFYGHRYPTLSLDEPTNFARLAGTADLDAEAPEEYDGPAVKNIYTRWLPSNTTVSQELTGRYVTLYRNPPKLVSMTLDAKDSSMWTGDNATVLTRQLTGETGEPIPTNLEVIEARESNLRDGAFTYVMQTFQPRIANTKYGLIGPDTLPDYLAASDAQRTRYAFITDNDGRMSNGDPGYVIA